MIVFFSGTGNSRAVAREFDRILDHSSMTIWVTPVYSWGLPPVVRRAIASYGASQKLPDFMKVIGSPVPPDSPHWLILTCGDDVGLAPEMWRRDMSKASFKPRYAFSVEMPNTYVSMKGFDVDSPEIEKRKLDAMPRRVCEIARRIEADVPGDDVVKGSFAWIKTRLIYPWFVANAMSPKPFKASDACVSCGLCAKTCPMANIALENNKPVWENNCAMCLACYHVCPYHAVDYGSKTLSKGQYKTLLKS